MRKQVPDMSLVKPPIEHAVNKMVKNLHAAAKKH